MRRDWDGLIRGLVLGILVSIPNAKTAFIIQ